MCCVEPRKHDQAAQATSTASLRLLQITVRIGISCVIASRQEQTGWISNQMLPQSTEDPTGIPIFLQQSARPA
eukprot:2076693-Pyramimonas_sp.AAC.1